MLKIVVSRRAAMDMRAIFKTSLRTWGILQAEIYLRSLSGAVENLREFQDMGKVLPIRDYRSLNIGHHFIIYRVTGERLHVVRVLHESMDIGQHLQS
jgi:toxin ParE1/3/4